MSQLIRFDYGDRQVRTVLVNEEPWWVANDVCGVLGITDPRKSINLLDPDERNTVPVMDSMGRSQDTFVINEPGLYSLILKSRKPEAKAFKRWVTHEVLPAIRRTGSYTTDQLSAENQRLLAIVASQTNVIYEMTHVITSQALPVRKQSNVRPEAPPEDFVKECCEARPSLEIAGWKLY
jgi:prophage antirepressor-like protein